MKMLGVFGIIAALTGFLYLSNFIAIILNTKFKNIVKKSHLAKNKKCNKKWLKRKKSEINKFMMNN